MVATSTTLSTGRFRCRSFSNAKCAGPPKPDAAAPGHVCPGSHAIDIVQPPGIGISPIADMDANQTIVTAALPTNSSAGTPKKAR